jgi:hypothetical protein
MIAWKKDSAALQSSTILELAFAVERSYFGGWLYAGADILKC